MAAGDRAIDSAPLDRAGAPITVLSRASRVPSLLLLGLLAGACGPDVRSHPEVEIYRDARFRLETPASPQAARPTGTNVTLPDAWRVRRPEASGVGIYEIALARALPGTRSWSVLLPRVNMNAEVFVNGTRVGAGGSFEEPVAQNFNRPLFFWFPSSLAAGEHNVITVRLFAYPFAQGGLGPVWVGPEEILRPAYERRLLLQQDASRLATAVAWLTSVFILALWVGTRFDGVYGWFALAIVCWSVVSLNYWVRDLPVSHWTWERIIHPAIEGFAVSLAIWAHRFLGIERPRLEALLAGFALLALALSLGLPRSSFYDVFGALHVCSFAIGAYATALVLARFRTFSVWERCLYLIGGAIGLAFATHDLAVQLGWIAPDRAHLLAYLVPVIVLGFGASLVRRFVASLETSEALNRELEQRVEEKSHEITSWHRRMRALEQERTLATERERIMREMHDGLGGQLVSALAMVESGGGSPAATAGALRTALADMRVVIDSLDPTLGNLAASLGALRSRVDPLLDRSGLRIEWRVGDLPDAIRLGPERSLHLLRIVQEAITNAVRHAAASTLVVEARRDGDAIRIEVRDDGRGFQAEAPAAGRGLWNMRQRAAALGARLDATSSAEGTRITLTLPVPQTGGGQGPR